MEAFKEQMNLCYLVRKFSKNTWEDAGTELMRMCIEHDYMMCECEIIAKALHDNLGEDDTEGFERKMCQYLQALHEQDCSILTGALLLYEAKAYENKGVMQRAMETINRIKGNK